MTTILRTFKTGTFLMLAVALLVFSLTLVFTRGLPRPIANGDDFTRFPAQLTANGDDFTQFPAQLTANGDDFTDTKEG